MGKNRYIILASVLAVLIIGVFVYFFLYKFPQNTETKGGATSSPNQIAEKKQITDGQLDNRILLTPDNIAFYEGDGESYDPNIPSKACQEIFNADDPNEQKAYESTRWGISFDVPWNAEWGNEKYRINPYDEIEPVKLNDTYGVRELARIQYGHIDSFEGCGWVRTDFVTILDKRTAAEVIDDIKSETTVYKNLEPVIANINGLEVVKYIDSGLCNYPTIIVIGKKYNYLFVPLCSDSFEQTEKVVETIKLLD